MSAGAAVEIIHRRRSAPPRIETASPPGRVAVRYTEEHLTARVALDRSAIDAVIEPSETRERVAATLLHRRR